MSDIEKTDYLDRKGRNRSLFVRTGTKEKTEEKRNDDDCCYQDGTNPDDREKIKILASRPSAAVRRAVISEWLCR